MELPWGPHLKPFPGRVEERRGRGRGGWGGKGGIEVTSLLAPTRSYFREDSINSIYQVGRLEYVLFSFLRYTSRLFVLREITFVFS